MRRAFLCCALVACVLAGCTSSSKTTDTQTTTASPGPDAPAVSSVPGETASPAATAGADASPAAGGPSPAGNGPSPAGAEPSTGASATAAASPGPSGAVPSPAGTVAFSDLGPVFGADKIEQLAQLGVFQPAGGTFDPYQPIQRRLFVRWMFNANNAVFRGDDTLQIRPVTPADDSTFKDVGKNDPDFPYIQALANAGVSVGFPDHTFRGDQPLTREQMAAMKTTLDDGGPAVADPSKDIPQAYFSMPSWKDKRSVSPEFAWAVADAGNDSGSTSMHNVSRVYGAIAEFKPHKPVTRAEAALELWVFRPHNRYASTKKSAADALAGTPAH